MAQWDTLVDGALASLAARRLLFNTRLIALAPPPAPSETRFTGPGPWDRATVEIQVDRTSIRQWLAASSSRVWNGAERLFVDLRVHYLSQIGGGVTGGTAEKREDERIAIFSDALNHASTIDGIRLVERQHQAVAFVYKHCDMSHLDFLLYAFSFPPPGSMP
uniref:Uncharacterized protein n=1 Tax=Aegilops tauschii TaxID=37682 RepID=R7W360_AEGTA